MTIGIDASRVSKKYKTGTEWYSYHLIKAMSEIEGTHHAQLYTRDPIPFSLSSSWREQRIAWPSDHFWTQGGLSLEMILHKPDVLFVPSHAIPFVHPRNTITTVHDVGFLEWREYRSKQDLAYLDWSTRYAVKECSRIIVVSEFTRQELIRIYGADPARVVTIHEGLDDIYHTGPMPADEYASVLKKYHVTAPYLLFVGRIDSRKNVARIVSAFELLKHDGAFDGELVLAGPLGFDGQELIQKISQSPQAHAIHHLGWIDEYDKRALMSAADVFVFPSLYEGFGLPVIEAQSCGAPVVCSNTTSLPEVAGDGALFVDPSDSDSIAHGITRMLLDEGMKKEYCQKGYQNARKFAWSQCARKTLDILEQAPA